MKATDISIGDIGKTVRSLTYRDKNKTTKPNSVGYYDEQTGRRAYRVKPQTYTILSIYAHSNGNILINQSIYLRADTEIEYVKEDND